MASRVLVRLVTFVASMLVATLLIFWVANSLPGDIVQVRLGLHASPDEVAQLREQLGLDQPWLVRYLEWVGGLCHGDFGASLRDGSPVAADIADRFAVTAWLTSFGMTGAILLAIPLGTFAAVNRRKWTGFASSALSQIALSIPAFWLGILLVLVFAVSWRLLPASGYVPLTTDPGEWLRHLILPVLSLAIVQASILSRYVRSAVIEVLKEDYFRTARAVGWSQARALLRHGSRNIALSVITVLGLQLATLLVGAIIIEQVFALPGLGSLLLMAVSQRDLVMVQAIVFLLVFTVLVINLVVDLGYLVIDPRLRRGGKARI